MRKTKIGIVGLHQSGKSLLINCLLKRVISKVGTGCATTHTPVYYYYSDDEYAEYFDNLGSHQIMPKDVINYDDKETINKIHVYINNSLLKRYTLIDLPGTGFNMADNTSTAQVLKELDYAILLATDVKEYTSSSSFYSNTLELLKNYNISYFFIFNCTKIDRWSPNNKVNIEIANSDLDLLQKFEPLSLLEEYEYPLVNLIWYWCSLVDSQDELYKLYYEDIRNYFERKGKELNKLLLEEASNFNVVSRIFDKSNWKLLELRRDFRNELKQIKNEICPIGTIQTFAFANIQDGWLVCDGRSLDIDEYPELFNTIGFTFGGNNYTKFQIPDLRGRFVRGWDKQGFSDPNREFGSLQDDAIQGHGHKATGELSYNGGHRHRTYHDDTSFKAGTNTFYSDNSFSKYTPYGEDKYNEYKKSSLYEFRIAETETCGNHTHSINKLNVTEVENCSHGTVRVAKETRPKNISLLYCIKATGGNSVVLNNAPHAEVDLRNLYVSENGCQYEGFVILTSEFSLKYNGRLVNDDIHIEVLNGINEKPVYLSKTNKSDHFKIREKGLYYLKYVYTGKHDNGELITNLTLVKIKTMGIIGDFSAWENSIEMTSDASDLRYSCTLKMKKSDRFKFRANNEWGIELDGDLSNLSLHKSNDLVCDKSGVYEITLDIHALPWHCELKLREKYEENTDSQTEDPSVKPSNTELDINNILGHLNFKF